MVNVGVRLNLGGPRRTDAIQNLPMLSRQIQAERRNMCDFLPGGFSFSFNVLERVERGKAPAVYCARRLAVSSPSSPPRRPPLPVLAMERSLSPTAPRPASSSTGPASWLRSSQSMA